MRFIGIIIALVIIGLLVQRQLAGPPPATEAPASSGVQAPQVPQTVKQVPGFESDMNNYMKDLNDQSRQRIEQNTQ